MISTAAQSVKRMEKLVRSIINEGRQSKDALLDDSSDSMAHGSIPGLFDHMKGTGKQLLELADGLKSMAPILIRNSSYAPIRYNMDPEHREIARIAEPGAGDSDADNMERYIFQITSRVEEIAKRYVSLGEGYFSGNDHALPAEVHNIKFDTLPKGREREMNFLIALSRNNLYLPEPHIINGCIDLIEKIFANGPANSLAMQIETLFNNSPAEELEGIIGQTDDAITQIDKVSDSSHTGIVFKVNSDEKIVYGKASADSKMLGKENLYLETAWRHSILQPITPKPLGIVNGKDVSVLFIYGTENHGIVPRDSLEEYHDLRNKAFTKYAKQLGTDSGKLLADYAMIDMFNRALQHSYMRGHTGEGTFGYNPVEIIAPADKIESFIADSNNPESVKELRTMLATYDIVADETTGILLAEKSPTVVSNDPRQENIFESADSTRPLGDYGLATIGSPILDVGKSEITNLGPYTEAYVYFRNMIEQGLGRNFEIGIEETNLLKKGSIQMGYLNAIRMAGFMQTKGREADAKRQLKLAHTYQGML